MFKVGTINGKSVYVSSTGKVRIGSKGSANHVSSVYGALDKGAARKLRKELYNAGYPDLAGQPRKAA